MCEVWVELSIGWLLSGAHVLQLLLAHFGASLNPSCMLPRLHS